jgi:hypothetical protein
MTTEAAHALERGEAVCGLRLQELQNQWRARPWQLDRSQYLVEVPTVHVLVQAYLSSAKTLLDFLAQLTTTEGVVGKVVHGFHKKGDDPGGQLLGFLKSRAAPGRRDQAERLRTYLAEQKDVWIDDLVCARDFLAHPKRRMAQIYWGIDLVEHEGTLTFKECFAPRIAGHPFHEFMASQTDVISAFARQYVRLVRIPEAEAD